MVVPHPGTPDGDAPHVRALRWPPLRPGGLGPRRADFDTALPPRGTRPLRPGNRRCPAVKAICTAPAGVRHERAWQLPYRAGCGVHRPGPPAGPGRGMPGRGCDWESIARRGCAVSRPAAAPPGILPVTSWPPGGQRRPRLGAPVLLAGPPGQPRTELSTRCSTVTRHRHRWTRPKCGSCCAPRRRGSLREVDPQVVVSPAATAAATLGPGACSVACAGTWNRAWAQYAAGPVRRRRAAGALLDLPLNASAAAGDRGRDRLPRDRAGLAAEIVRDSACSTRLTCSGCETLRARRPPRTRSTTAGPTDPASLGAGVLHRILARPGTQRRADGDLYSANDRNLMIYEFGQVIEYGRASGPTSAVPDRSSRHRQPAARIRTRTSWARPARDGDDELTRAWTCSARPAGRGDRRRRWQLTDQVIDQVLRETVGARRGSRAADRLRQVTGGQHNLI